MRIIALLVIISATAHAGCVALSSGRILAGDLASSVPALYALDPATVMGYAPLPGTQRNFRGKELRSLAQRQGIEAGDIPDVCVERQVRLLTSEEVRTALLQALPVPDAQLELIEFSSQPLPAGRLEFPIAALSKPRQPEIPVIWRGRLVYDGGHSASIWARVRITVERSWLVAAEDIPAGSVIQARQVRPESRREFPAAEPALRSVEAVAGKVARRRILAGQQLVPSAIQEPPDVAKAEKIRVRVRDGMAVLFLDAVAESSGKKGDSILVHNPSSGRNFRAVVEDRALAVVDSSAGN